MGAAQLSEQEIGHFVMVFPPRLNSDREPTSCFAFATGCAAEGAVGQVN